MKYTDMCHDCGEKNYTVTQQRWLSGITVALIECPECGEEKGVIPGSDWRRACEGSRNMDDWD